MAVSENDLLVGPLTPADGVTLISLDFTFVSNAWIVVYKSGSETPLVQDTAYTVAGAGTGSGSITLAVAANGIDTYSVYSVVPLSRPSDLQARGEFKSDPFNLEFDRIWQAMQGQRTQINRSLKLSLSSAVSVPSLLSFTAGSLLAIDATGQYIIAGPSSTQLTIDTAAAAQAALDTAADLVLTNADVVLTNADAAATAADLVQTNQDTLDTAADLVLTNADVASTAQDALDTAADVLLTNADVVTTNADAATTTQDAIDTAADVVLTGADVGLTNADVVLTNADVAATVALYDNFDDRYLGSKASAPTLDNDGNTILEGALYWNATTGAFFVRNGAGEWSGAVFDTAGAMFGANNGSDFDNVVTVRTNLGLGSAAVADAADFATAAQGGLADSALQNAAAFATAAQGVLADAAAPLDAPDFTGIPLADTATPGTNTRQLATMEALQAGLATAGGGVSSQTFTASGTWTRPAGVKFVQVFVTGAGGDAAADGSPTGQSGGTAIKVIDVSAIASATITVGAWSEGVSGAASTTGGFSRWADGTNTVTGQGGNGGGGGVGGDLNLSGAAGNQSTGRANYWGTKSYGAMDGPLAGVVYVVEYK